MVYSASAVYSAQPIIVGDDLFLQTGAAIDIKRHGRQGAELHLKSSKIALQRGSREEHFLRPSGQTQRTESGRLCATAATFL
jgi:hypothetical protein